MVGIKILVFIFSESRRHVDQPLFMTYPFLGLATIERVSQHLIVFLLLVVNLLEVVLFYFGHLIFQFELIKFSAILSRDWTIVGSLDAHSNLMRRIAHFGRLNRISLKSLDMNGRYPVLDRASLVLSEANIGKIIADFELHQTG